MSTLKPIVSAATIAAMAPPPARTKSPPFCLPGARASAPPRPRFQGVFNTENAAKLAPLWDGKMPSEKFHPAPAEGAFVAVQMMKEACGRFSQPARALPISSTQIGNLLVIQSFASTSLWNPEISSKAPSSQVARTAQVSAEDVSECRIWRAGSFVMIALAVNQPPSGPLLPDAVGQRAPKHKVRARRPATQPTFPRRSGASRVGTRDFESRTSDA